MPQLKYSEIRKIDQAFDMSSGYVLNFSDRTMKEFFEDEFGINIYDEIYACNGTSKAKRLRTFIEIESSTKVGRVLRKLWEYRETIYNYAEAPNKSNVKDSLFDLLGRMESGGLASATDVIDSFTHDETLEELVAAIDRDIVAGKPQIALDRLHTYCHKKVGHLLEARGKNYDTSAPLHGRAGIYIKELSNELDLSDMSTQIAKSVIGVFEKYNFVRNNNTLAHDNTLLSAAEARFIYDGVVAFLRFMKAIEKSRFE